MLEIRRMEPRDIEQVAAIEAVTFSEPWKAEDFSRSLASDSDFYFVAEEDGEIAGYCGLWGVIDEGQITNVAVKEEYRNRGIAEKMLKELMAESIKHRYTEFTLEVRVSNAPAIRLYHKLGFKDEGIRKGFYSKPCEDAIIMWKRNSVC